MNKDVYIMDFSLAELCMENENFLKNHQDIVVSRMCSGNDFMSFVFENIQEIKFSFHKSPITTDNAALSEQI